MIRLRSTEELVARIRQVFPTAPLPLDEDIRSDSYLVNKYLQGKSWPEVTAKGMRLFDFDGPSSYLSFLSPKGFCYYLPAYLMMAFFETSEEDRHQYFNLYYCLTPQYA